MASLTIDVFADWTKPCPTCGGLNRCELQDMRFNIPKNERYEKYICSEEFKNMVCGYLFWQVSIEALEQSLYEQPGDQIANGK